MDNVFCIGPVSCQIESDEKSKGVAFECACVRATREATVDPPDKCIAFTKRVESRVKMMRSVIPS